MGEIIDRLAFYSARRPYSTLGYVSPLQFERPAICFVHCAVQAPPIAFRTRKTPIRIDTPSMTLPRGALVCITVLLFVCLATFDLGRPPVDSYQYRQTHTLSNIYNYYLGALNLLKPELDTNGSHANVVLELPLYQVLVAAIMKILGYNEIIARLVNVAATLVSAWTVARLADDGLRPGTFVFVFAAFLLNPSTIFWASVPLADPVGLMAALLGVYGFLTWLHAPRTRYYVLALICAAVAVTIKVTSAFIPLGVFFSTVLFQRDSWKNHRRKMLMLVAAALATVGAFAAWNAYSRWMNIINPHVYTSYPMDWYLGTTRQRLSPELWEHMGRRIIYNNFAWVGVIGLVVTALVCRFNPLSKPLYIGLTIAVFSLLYLFLFVNLNYMHTVYQLPLNAANAVVGGLGASMAWTWLGGKRKSLAVSAALCALLLLAGAAKIVLGGRWVDVAPISSPYEPMACEHDIGLQIKGYLDEYNGAEHLIGVVFDPDAKCWSGPHSIFYFMKRRGYWVRKIDDPQLEREPLDLIVVIGRDRIFSVKNGWRQVFERHLTGAVSDFRFALLQRDAECPRIELQGSQLAGRVGPGSPATPTNLSTLACR